MATLLRDYQREAIDAIVHPLWELGHTNGLVVMATGLGKTETFKDVALQQVDYREGQRVLFMAQSTALVYQMYNRFAGQVPGMATERVTPRQYKALGMEMANLSDSDARFLIATRQTMAKNNGDRLRQCIQQYGAFDLWIIDEADVSITDEYQLIHEILLEANPNLKWLGFTATTTRSDGLALGIRFERLLFERNVRWGIMAGWLKQIEAYTVDLVNTYDEKFNALEFENWMNKHFQVWEEYGGWDRHAIHFLPSLETGRAFCQFMQAQGVPAVHIDSELCIDLDGNNHVQAGMSYLEHRLMVFRQLQEDAIYVTNKDVLTRGFDWRKCNMLMNSATTDQDATFTQRIGRGTRLPPGVSNLFYNPSDQTYRITWDGGRIETVSYRDLPFFPTTILLDFSRSTAAAETIGSLFGGMTIPPKPEPQEAEEEEEGEEDDLRVSVKPVAAQQHRVKERRLFKSFDTNWYTDPDSDASTTFGNNTPVSLFITAPRMDFARKVFAKSLELEIRKDDPDQESKLFAVNTVYDIVSNWFIWVTDTMSEPFFRANMSWQLIPAGMLYGIRSANPTLDSALNQVPSLEYQIYEQFRNTEHEVDFQKLRRYRNSKTGPTAAQLKLIKQLRNTSLPNAGLTGLTFPDPTTLTEASLMINHFMFKALQRKYIASLLNGKRKKKDIDEEVYRTRLYYSRATDNPPDYSLPLPEIEALKAAQPEDNAGAFMDFLSNDQDVFE